MKPKKRPPTQGGEKPPLRRSGRSEEVLDEKAVARDCNGQMSIKLDATVPCPLDLVGGGIVGVIAVSQRTAGTGDV